MNCAAVGCQSTASKRCPCNDPYALFCSKECQKLAWGLTHACNDGVSTHLPYDAECGEDLVIDCYTNANANADDDDAVERVVNGDSQPIGISIFSVAKTGVKLGLAARDLYKLGRVSRRKKRAGLPKNKAWLSEMKQSGYSGFWNIFNSTGFVNVLEEIESRSPNISVNVAFVPSDASLDTYFKRVTGGRQGLKAVVADASKSTSVGDAKQDLLTELLAAHFFSFASEGQVCVQLSGADASPIIACGPLSVKRVRLPDSSEFNEIEKSVLRGPDAKEKLGLSQGPIKLVTGAIKRKAQKQDQNTWIFFINFVIVPEQRAQQFPSGRIVKSVRKVGLVKRAKKKARKVI